MSNKIRFNIELDSDSGVVFISNENGSSSCEYEYNPNKLRESVMFAVSDWLHYYLNK